MSSTEGPDVDPPTPVTKQSPPGSRPGTLQGDAAGPVPPVPPVPQPGPTVGPPAPQWYPAPYNPAFAPVARAPRSPWINPERRAAAIVLSIVAAVLLLGVGVVIGALAIRAHGRDGGFDRSRMWQQRQYGQYGQPGVPRRAVPTVAVPQPAAPVTVVPQQTVTSTVVVPAPATTS